MSGFIPWPLAGDDGDPGLLPPDDPELKLPSDDWNVFGPTPTICCVFELRVSGL